MNPTSPNEAGLVTTVSVCMYSSVNPTSQNEAGFVTAVSVRTLV